MSKLSYVHGASDKPLIGQTIGRYFDEACSRHSSREALVVRHQKVRLTYCELRQKVDALACGLRRIYLRTDDHRLAAIATYLKLGWRPRTWDEDSRRRWQAVGEALGLACRPIDEGG